MLGSVMASRAPADLVGHLTRRPALVMKFNLTESFDLYGAATLPAQCFLLRPEPKHSGVLAHTTTGIPVIDLPQVRPQWM
jgi:hypothetical protein